MIHTDHMYQLRQLRNHELLIEAQQARIIQECVRTKRLPKSTGIGRTSVKLVVRYARYVLSTLATVGFGITLN